MSRKKKEDNIINYTMVEKQIQKRRGKPIFLLFQNKHNNIIILFSLNFQRQPWILSRDVWRIYVIIWRSIEIPQSLLYCTIFGEWLFGMIPTTWVFGVINVILQNQSKPNLRYLLYVQLGILIMSDCPGIWIFKK